MSQKTFTLDIRQRLISLPTPCVMGVINLTTASFHQGFSALSDILNKTQEMIDAGVSIIDVGAVATNPKINMAEDIPSVQEECGKVVQVVQAIKEKFNVLVSVDTCQPEVMKAAVAAGADIINDQRSLREPNALEVAAELAVPVCLMHHFKPARKPDSCNFDELVKNIHADLESDVSRCLKAGISRERIIIDPGFGGGNFGKSADENFYLLSQLHTFSKYQLPLLAGLSRKSMFAILNLSVEERLNASVVGATIAALQGADIIRAHDVKETVEAMKIIRKYHNLSSG